MRAWSCAVVLVAACGAGLGGGGDDQQPDADADTGSDGSVEPGWEMLIQRSWSITPSVENYLCKRIMIEEDTYISAFKPLSPPGTHHEILTISTTPGTTGDYDCDSSNHDPQMLFAGGAGTDEMLFPPGVAIKLPKGTYINLNLHVFNLTDAAMNGISGIQIKRMNAADVVHEADMMFLGTRTISIPPTNQPDIEPGSCSAPTTWNIFNFWPHMHGYAKHQKVTVRRGNGTIDTLLDTDYNFYEQKNYPMPPVQIATNEVLRVDCTYVNDTNVTAPPGYTITYGESATQEMCYAGFYKYPAGGDLYFCAKQ